MVYWLNIIHPQLTTPQGNGQAKSSNKFITTLLIKLLNDLQNDWDEHLAIILFAYWIFFTAATGISYSIGI